MSSTWKSLSLLAILAFAQPAWPQFRPLPRWVVKLIASQPQHGGDVIEEATYQGHRAFEILPANRASDSGNEHVLRAEDGHIICEFGGFSAQVTVGSCALNQIKYVRTLHSRHKG